MKKRVLIVDDDEKLQKLVKDYLKGYEYEVLSLYDGLSVCSTIEGEPPDIIILDIMLPEKDGLEVLKEIRMEFTIPVIMLTAKGEDTDRIIGLELGADDYLPKPFNPRELLARMKAVMRRHSPGNKNVNARANETRLIKSGDLTLNKAKQTVYLKNIEIELSSTEYKLLEVLMMHPNTVLSRDQLMNMARGREFMAFDRSIDVHISKLRAKFDTHPKSSKRIKTIWGSGYMFVDA